MADADGISEDDYVNDKVIQGKNNEKIKDEYNFDDTKDAFDEEKIPPQRWWWQGKFCSCLQFFVS